MKSDGRVSEQRKEGVGRKYGVENWEAARRCGGHL